MLLCKGPSFFSTKCDSCDTQKFQKILNNIEIILFFLCQVGLADRSLMPGDVVRRMIQGQDSQRGYVRRTSVKCHLQLLGTNKIIANVDSKEVEPLRVGAHLVTNTIISRCLSLVRF